MNQTPPQPQRLNILIIGDWVVDNNWVLGTHDSSISTNTGREFFRALHHPSNSITRFCGAGRVAALLHAARGGIANHPVAFQIKGLGLWHTHDEPVLGSLFVSESAIGQSPYVVASSPSIKQPDDITLFNLAPTLVEAGYKPIMTGVPSPALLQEHFGTTRIFRFYQQERGRLVLLSRIDWELPPGPEHGEPAWLKESHLKDRNVESRLDELFAAIGPVDVVVVKDLCKGVVSSALITSLLSSQRLALAQKPWFVSTKAWSPAWLPILQRETSVKLIHFPEVAFLNHRDVPTWMTTEGKPTLEAIDAMTTVANRFCSHANGKVCVAATGPRLRAMLVEVTHKSKATSEPGSVLYVHPHENPNDIEFANAVGNGSAFFAGMVFGLLPRSCEIGPRIHVSTSDLFRGSLDSSQQWIAQEARWLEHPEDCAPPREIELFLEDMKEESHGRPKFELKVVRKGEIHHKVESIEKLETYSTDVEVRLWQESLSGTGIVTKEPESEMPRYAIEMWRATIELPGYICCIRTKRNLLAKLRNEITAFGRFSQMRSASGLLVAGPGSGKSHLVKALAEIVKLTPLSFNMTTLCKREDILACFDEISTVQSQVGAENGRVLAFFDEIDTEISGQPVFDVFLAPLEDGYYVRNGFKVYLKPCLWLFAASMPEKDLRRRLKGEDFISRLTLDVIDLNVEQGKYRDSLKTERIYRGVAVARSAYPDLRSLTKRVLTVLNKLKPEMSSRDIRRFVERNLRVNRGLGDWRHAGKICEANYRDLEIAPEQVEAFQRGLLALEEESVVVIGMGKT